MSKGPGRIERAIYDLFEKHPDGAWTTEDLCRLIYPAADRIEKKHRVAVIRGMKTIRANIFPQLEVLSGKSRLSLDVFGVERKLRQWTRSFSKNTKPK